jgi:cardiolipin synthase (CMP-forming)
MKKSNIPNIITFIRLILIIPVVYTLLTEQYRIAFFVFMLASLSDGLDGFLARYFNWTSRFGAIADPLADKLLMTITYFSLAYLGLVPYWLVALVIGRDIIIIMGAIAYSSLVGMPDFSATLISKINTVLQLLLVVVLLFVKAFPTFMTVLMFSGIMILVYLVAATTLISLIDYCVSWGYRAWRAKKRGEV